MEITVEIPSTSRVLKQSKKIIAALEAEPNIGPNVAICVTWEKEVVAPSITVNGTERADLLPIVAKCM